MSPVVPPFLRGEGFGTLGSAFVEPTLPSEVPLTPVTWGAWITLAALGLVVALLLLLLVRRSLRRAHRRAARRQLSALQQAWRTSAGAARAQALARLPALLKLCALGSFERSRVAPLAGQAWSAFLSSTAPGVGFEAAAGHTLVTLCERGANSVPEAEVPALFAASDRWMARHRV